MDTITQQQKIDHQIRSWDGTISSELHFFATEEDLPTLRGQAEAISGFMEMIRTRTSRLAELPVLHHDGKTTQTVLNAQTVLAGLAEMYLLTGEKEWEEKLRERIDQTFDLPTWVAPVHAHGPSNYMGPKTPENPYARYTDKGMEFDHCCANVAAAVAVALDALFSVLSKEALREYRRRLIEKVVEPYRKICSEESEFWTIAVNNWRSMISADMLLVILAVWPEYEYRREVLDYALAGILAVLDHAPKDGEYGEGFGYWDAAFGLPIRGGLVLRKATQGRIDVLQHPYLSATVDFFYHGIGPNGRPFHFGDCGPEVSPTAILMLDLLAAIHGGVSLSKRGITPALQSLFDLFLLRETEQARQAGQKSARTASPNIIPLARHFRDIGLVFLRSGWGSLDTFVAFKGGPSSFSHGHLDIGDWMVTYRGQTLVADVGTWPYANHIQMFVPGIWDHFDNHGTRGHSSLLIDHRGQCEEGRGEIVVFQAGREMDQVVLDATSVYRDRVDRFIRHLIFVKPDLIFILDDVRARKPRWVEWLIHPLCPVSGTEHDLTILGEKAGLHLDFLLPDQDGWVRDEVSSLTSYEADDKKQMVRKPHRFVSFRKVHPLPQVRFLAAISLFGREQPTVGQFRLVEANGEKVIVTFTKETRSGRLTIPIGEPATLMTKVD